ncbi:MAG: hypothetical protein QXY73_01415 [Candidatus Bathyarchaeia archaeon]
MRCKICDRVAVDKGYCDLHIEAYINILEKYKVWKEAVDISWKDYLSEIIKNPLTGNWAKEVAEKLLKDGESVNGT